MCSLLAAVGKKRNVVIAAIAREMAAILWAIVGERYEQPTFSFVNDAAR